MLVRRELSDLTLKPRLRRGGGETDGWGAAIFIRGRFPPSFLASEIKAGLKRLGSPELGQPLWSADCDEGGTAKPIAALLDGRREVRS